jgi:plastocyanin
MLGRISLVMMLAVAACGGGDDGGGNGTIDAPAGTADAPAAATVKEVACAGGEMEVTTDNASFVYSPAATTITQGQAVKFTMSSTHDVAPVTNAQSDPGLRVGFGQSKCLMFTATGTFKFKCTPHGFTGTVTVN